MIIFPYRLSINCTSKLNIKHMHTHTAVMDAAGLSTSTIIGVAVGSTVAIIIIAAIIVTVVVIAACSVRRKKKFVLPCTSYICSKSILQSDI